VAKSYKKETENMKRAYNAPKLTVHGNVEEITKAFGGTSTADTYQYNNQTFDSRGSRNGVVIPTGN
jgi:hypothetical protein